uniref:Uncharacterized protein n=1 Tax=Lactuca sativa TaxID=4236 RepID=A0A9R1VAV2_LACSA|nr:hypothetical protein LSAT_V11C600329160 [Lactuca sativa]
MSLQASRSNPKGISDILIPSFNQVLRDTEGNCSQRDPYSLEFNYFFSCAFNLTLFYFFKMQVRIVKSFDPQTTLLLIMELQ